LAVNKLDPKIIFASTAPAQDTPAVFPNKTNGWGESRKNGGRPTIKQMNALQQETDLKLLWLNENAVTPYDATIDYPNNAVVIKDNTFKILDTGVWKDFVSRDVVSKIKTIPTYYSAVEGVNTVTGVADGAYYNVRSSSDESYVDEYQNIGGSAVATGKSYPSSEVVQKIANYTALPFVDGKSYPLNAQIMLTNGDIVKNTVTGNTVDPNVDMTGWLSEIETSVGGIHINEFLSAAELRDAMKSSPVLDHTQAWRKAVAACPENGTIVGDPKHTYNIKIQSDGWNILIEKSIKIDMRGANIIYKPWADSNPAATHTPAFFFRGGTNAKVAIDQTLVRHNVIKCSDVSKASEFATGDYVFVYSNALYKQWNYPETTYGSGQFSGVGELQQIESVNTVTGEIKLSRITENPYYSQAYVQKLNPLINPSFTNVSNATEIDANVISSKSLGADCGHFVSFDVCVNPKMSENSVRGHRMFVGWMGRCWQALADRNRSFVTNALYPMIGGHAYCIRHHHSFGAVSRQNFGFRSRHLIDYTSSHDCAQYDNIGIGCNTPYLTHGFFERRIKSYNDKSFGSISYVGWSIGNPSFNGSFECSIIQPSGNDAISVNSCSDDVEIQSPRIEKSSPGSPLMLRSGAKNVKIYGKGFLKIVGDQNTSNVVTSWSTANYSGNIGGDILSAVATAGNNSVVKLIMQSAHGRLVGQEIYIDLRDINGGAEWSGYYTVASSSKTNIDGDTLTYIRNGVTTANLNIVTAKAFSLFKAGDFKPVENVSIRDVYVESPVTFVYDVFGLSVEGNVEVDGVEFNLLPNQIACAINSATSKSPESINFSGNKFKGTHRRAITIVQNAPLKSLIIKDNNDTEYTESFVSLRGDAAKLYAVHNIKIKGNTLSAPSPTVGVSNFNIWNLVKNGASVSGNSYPLNAVATHATNKNWEYGTWTPSLVGETTAGSATYTRRLGHYQLDGRSLKIKGRVQVSAFTGVGQMQITGIPCSNNGYVAPVATAETDLVFTGQLMPAWVGTFIRLRQSNAGNIEDVPVKANIDLVFHSTLDLTSS
jgi:hypothetical protein